MASGLIPMKHAMSVCNVVSVLLQIARCELYVVSLAGQTSCRFDLHADLNPRPPH